MNELNFLDIVILRKIDAESSVEKFGSMINTSFFETANLLGTVKIKGYINIESSVGGISRVTITDAGSSILVVADQRSKEPIEPLDNAILQAIAGGSRELEALQQALNIRSADLAYHINKLISQGFMDYEVKSAKVYFVLTETGFNATGGVRVQQTLAQPAAEKQPTEDELASEIAGSKAGGIVHPKRKEEPPKKKEEPPQKKKERFFTPPWVKPAEVKKPEKKEEHKPDVAHIIKEEHAPERKKEKEQPQKPLTPEEEERQKKMKRLASKIEYYIAEYAMYIAIIVVVLLVLIALVFFAVAKLG